MADREQTRRDSEALERLIFDCEFDEDFAPVAEELKRVRAELEQAERERDEAQERERVERDLVAQFSEDDERSQVIRDLAWKKCHELEARLAKVPALVEALRDAVPVVDELIAWINTDTIGCVEVEQRATPVWHRMKNALAAFEEPGAPS